VNDWGVFDSGQTIGERGSEQGRIVRDEEHPIGARITLEEAVPLGVAVREGVNAWAITCGGYGALVHTRFFGSRRAAESAYDEMKPVLAQLASIEGALSQTERNPYEEFVRRYPT